MTAQEKSNTWTSGRVVFGILITLALFFLIVCAASYSPLDPPGRTYAALQQPVHNLCGVPGAFCANLLYRFCGYGVWFLLAALFLRVVSYWRMPRLRNSILKACGTALMLMAVSGALSAFLTRYTAPPAADTASRSEETRANSDTDAAHAETPAALKSKFSALAARLAAQQTELGPGGELGASVRFLLDKKLHIAPAGIAVFLLFMFAAGLILVSDSRLLHFLLMIVGLRQAAEIFLPQKTDPALGTGEDPAPEKTKPQKRPAPKPEPIEEEPAEEEEEEEEQTEEESEEEIEPSYRIPPIDILPYADPVSLTNQEAKIASEMRRLQKAFDDYDCDVRVVGYQSGPVITLYELELLKGQKIQPLNGLTNELAIAMKVPTVRIVSPIPGKSSVGVEVPNKERQLVRLRNVMEESAESAARMQIPLFLGKDVTGNSIVADLAKLPHMLIGGRTGTGKSVCLNSIILSILMTRTPREVRMILIDPKMVELSPYKQIPHLACPVVTDMKKAPAILNWLCVEMDERYRLLARVGVRQLKEYNSLSLEKLRQRFQPQSQDEWEKLQKKIPALVVIADEMADMMAIAGKDLEEYIARLAAKSRAVGIYLILATQKPTVNVVTGLIRSNLPARIAFGVATQTDSRVILDENGADKLLGNGDLLFLNSVTNQIIRGQGTFVSDDEIYAVNCEISTDRQKFLISDEDFAAEIPQLRHFDDPLYEEAVSFIVTQRRASTSLLQRKFSIGYGRAAKIMDEMESQGIISAKGTNDAKPRDVLISLEQWNQMNAGEEPAPPEIPAPFLPTPEFHRPKPPKKHPVSPPEKRVRPKENPPFDEEPLTEEQLDFEEIPEEDERPEENLSEESYDDEEEASWEEEEEEYTEEDEEEYGDEEEYEEDGDLTGGEGEEADSEEELDDEEEDEPLWEDEEEEPYEDENFVEYTDEDFDETPSSGRKPIAAEEIPDPEEEEEPEEDRPSRDPQPDLRELARRRRLRKQKRRKKFR
ncbi:MAG: DNA translocase FtsK [Thermoguttaceae bacterium]|nr:DNA translocase FtsK [Thermoguttaceae bacterium]